MTPLYFYFDEQVGCVLFDTDRKFDPTNIAIVPNLISNKDRTEWTIESWSLVQREAVETRPFQEILNA